MSDILEALGGGLMALLLGMGIVAVVLWAAVKVFLFFANRQTARWLTRVDPALRDVVTELERRFADADPPIERIARDWSYGSPKFLVLFASREDEQRAHRAGPEGLAARLRDAVAELVQAEERFGHSREGFDVEKGLWLVSDSEFFESLVKGYADRRDELGVSH